MVAGHGIADLFGTGVTDPDASRLTFGPFAGLQMNAGGALTPSL